MVAFNVGNSVICFGFKPSKLMSFQIKRNTRAR